LGPKWCLAPCRKGTLCVMKRLGLVFLFFPAVACGLPDANVDQSSLERTVPELSTDNTVRDRDTSFACTTNEPPTATTSTINLWPPNHRLHAITAANCVTITDDCDEDLEASLVWASSDEPANSIGDGNTAADIIAGCDAFELRSERQGPRNGRVYHLGWRVEDSDGNVLQGSCAIIVDHDQSAAITEDDGEAYRVELDPASCEEDPNPCPDPNNPSCF
jgi:hypothetical protein